MIAAFFKRFWAYAVLGFALAAALLGWRAARAVAAKTRLELDIAKADAKNAKAAAIRERDLAEAGRRAQAAHDLRVIAMKAVLADKTRAAAVKADALHAEVADTGTAADEINRRAAAREAGR